MSYRELSEPDKYEAVREELNRLNAEYVKVAHEIIDLNETTANNSLEQELDKTKLELSITQDKLRAVINYLRDRDFGILPEIDIDSYLDSVAVQVSNESALRKAPTANEDIDYEKYR